MTSRPTDQYTHGHSASVVEAHSTRTIANSAAYLEPHLRPGNSLIDVGCGPGTITAELADRVAPGPVLGVDLSAEVIAGARDRFPHSEARFEVMDTYALDVGDATYDIAHAHQVLQHLSDPVAALVEIARVVKPGGVVAVRDADYAAMHWSPGYPELDRWLDVYRQVAYANEAEPDAGRYLRSWARQAGFDDVDIAPTLSTWLFADDEGRGWWGTSLARRIVESSLADQAVEFGISDRHELAELAAGWRRWAEDPEGWFVLVHTELICRVPT